MHIHLFGDSSKIVADLVEAKIDHRELKEQLVKMETKAEKLEEKYREVLREAPDDFDKEEIRSQVELGIGSKMYVT